MTTKTRKRQTSPSKRANLARYQDRAHAIVEGRLAELGRTWNWLSVTAAEEGLCSKAVIMQWKRGRNRGVNVGVYLGCIDILDFHGGAK